MKRCHSAQRQSSPRKLRWRLRGQKIKVKIGKVLFAEKVPNTDKLMRLEVDFGEEKRQILTAMAHFFEPEFFIGKQMPFVVNLESRKIKGFESQGMIMAINNENGKPVFLLPETKVPNGSDVI